jgi:hypothetical protein
MAGYFIFHQGISDLEIWASPENYPKEVIHIAVRKAFPFGSDWADFVQARSVKLIRIVPNVYLLTYTLVLGGDSKWPAGTLHTWGIVDTPVKIYEEIKRRKGSPLVVFEEQSHMFKSDPLYNFMIAGLKPKLSTRTLSRLNLTLISWIQLQLGLKIQLISKYNSPIQWHGVEEIIFRAFEGTIWKTRLRALFGMEPCITSFTTLSLSVTEEAQIIGIAE